MAATLREERPCENPTPPKRSKGAGDSATAPPCEALSLAYDIVLNVWWPAHRRPGTLHLERDIVDLRHIMRLRQVSRHLRAVVDQTLPPRTVKRLHVPVLNVCCADTSKWRGVFDVMNERRYEQNANWPFHYDSMSLTETSWGDRYAFFCMEAPFHTLRELRRTLSDATSASTCQQLTEAHDAPAAERLKATRALARKFIAQAETVGRTRKFPLLLCLIATICSPLMRDRLGRLDDATVYSFMRAFLCDEPDSEIMFRVPIDASSTVYSASIVTALWAGLRHMRGCGLDAAVLREFCDHNDLPPLGDVAHVATSVLALPLLSEGDAEGHKIKAGHSRQLCRWLRGTSLEVVAPGDVAVPDFTHPHCCDVNRMIADTILNTMRLIDASWSHCPEQYQRK